MNQNIGMPVGRFHYSVALRLAKMQPRRDMTGRWVYPPLDEDMMSVGMEEEETYVLRRQNTVAQYITT